MTRTVRLVVAGALVVVLVAVSYACTGPGPAVPPALVGRWKGGAHTNGPWYYEFAADGRYRAWAARSPGTVDSGTVVVDDTTLTFSNGGVPVASTWSLAGGRLLLDGAEYVRA